MKDATVLSLAGMLLLAAIVITCLMHGIDHVVLASIVTIIAGLAGYQVRKRREPETEEE
jgi:4-hydroxybenzoate polyprenyltransferase